MPEECPTCDGFGRVQLTHRDFEEECPTCGGSGEIGVPGGGAA